jgi:methylenetetrahydrofolate reductase (NADPH)
VIGGDSDRPEGPYGSADDLLRAMQEAGTGFPQVGIAGYPEAHPRIPAETLDRALWAKAPLASYLVSNLCFDPGLVADWLISLRERGLGLPVRLGVPGPVQIPRLARIARRIGVGDSTRFLVRNRRLLTGLGGYDPGPYVRRLRDRLAGGQTGVVGLHLYCFNDFEATERWLAAELDPGAGTTPRPR